MDWLDDVVRDATPRELGATVGAKALAESIALSAVAEANATSRRSGMRKVAGGLGIGIGVLAVGVGAAAAAPVVVDWLGWTPDIVAQRTFDLEGGPTLGLCEVYMRVIPDYSRDVTDDEVDRRTEAARVFLTDHDWDPLIASITAAEIQNELTRDQEQREAATTETMTPPPATLSGAATRLISMRVSQELDRAGYLQPGVALESAAGPCTGESGAGE
ncbi:hypothetical protein [Agromyces mangrovi Wang et al. 2018]|uniref:hypothetical protein n=1 Tax=Agromyces mangrovi TaxID=1858653 RepID=UPI00257449EF|nr:hypothetical protein [Agromyces mangrovi]BDZ64861.1 hypothetical protein GCM10025877_17990 [Agromyces mangrovi]